MIIHMHVVMILSQIWNTNLKLLLLGTSLYVGAVLAQFCDPGWVLHQGTCFKSVTSEAENYADSHATCQDMGASLATYSAVEALQNNNGLYAYLGYSGVWEWADSNTDHVACISHLLSWMTGMPSTTSGERCARVGLYQAIPMFKDGACSSTYGGVLCEKPLAEIGTRCELGWLTEADRCYSKFTSTGDFRAAQRTCADHEAVVAAVTSFVLQDHFLSMRDSSLSAPDLWVANKFSLLWLDTRGSLQPRSVLDPYWATGHPHLTNNGSQPCVVLNGTSGKLEDVTCETAQSYICEKQPYSTAPTVKHFNGNEFTVDPTAHRLLRTLPVHNRMRCAAACGTHEQCVGFTTQQDTGSTDIQQGVSQAGVNMCSLYARVLVASQSPCQTGEST